MDLPGPGIKLGSPALQVDSLLSELSGRPQIPHATAKRSCMPQLRSGTAKYSCLENPMDGGAWNAAVHGVTEGRTPLSFHFHFSLSCIGEGNANPLQCSCLENPRDGGAWWAAIYGVTQSRTRRSDLTFTFHFHALEKEMATHSSVLA